MKDAGRDKDGEMNSILRSMDGAGARPVVTVDYERYAHFLDNSDLTEDQKRAFLQALWSIIVEFVSMGFGVHPVQQAQNACGKPEETAPKPAPARPDAVKCSHKVLASKFVSAAGPKAD